MKMFVAFIFIAAFALPAAFATKQDVIALRAHLELLKNEAANRMTKNVISSPFPDIPDVPGSPFSPFPDVPESPFSPFPDVPGSPFSPFPNVQDVSSHSADVSTHFADVSTLVPFHKKGNLGGIPICGETCFGGACNTPGCTCVYPICMRNSLDM